MWLKKFGFDFLSGRLLTDTNFLLLIINLRWVCGHSARKESLLQKLKRWTSIVLSLMLMAKTNFVGHFCAGCWLLKNTSISITSTRHLSRGRKDVSKKNPMNVKVALKHMLVLGNKEEKETRKKKTNTNEHRFFFLCFLLPSPKAFYDVWWNATSKWLVIQSPASSLAGWICRMPFPRIMNEAVEMSQDFDGEVFRSLSVMSQVNSSRRKATNNFSCAFFPKSWI